MNYLAKISADNTEPMILPWYGTLLTFGSSHVTRMFFSPLTGNLE